MKFSVLVEVSPRAGIADPQGATIERSLAALDYRGVSQVRVGKAIRFVIDAASAADADSQVRSISERFLANPVIEDWHIEVQELVDR